jgi:GTPase
MVSFFKLKSGKKKQASGGSGGRGGSVVIKACNNLSTLYVFSKKIHYKAENGKNGQSNNKKGEDGEDLIINVPAGTIIKNDRGEIIADLDGDEKQIIIAEGGEGGRGNASFVSYKRRFPAFAEKGERTEDFWINLELRIIADVSLVGFPNSGKSTIISRISAAKPKIADYPFTTLAPNLGVVTANDENFVVADMPGLIKGAHKGDGLGDKFLRHITRSALLAIVLDGEKVLDEKKDIIKDFDILREEIRLYNRDLYEKDYLILVNKIDLIGDNDKLNRIRKVLEKKSGKSVFLISAITGKGIDELVWNFHRKVKEYKEKVYSGKEKYYKEKGRVRVYQLSEKQKEKGKMEILKDNDDYIIKNKELEKMVSMTDLENEEALDYLMNKIKKTGVAGVLKKRGLVDGDTVIIGKLVFTFKE